MTRPILTGLMALAALTAPATAVAAMPTHNTTPVAKPTALLDEAIAKVRAMSLHRKTVDWPALEARVRAEAAGATDIVDLFPALQTLLTGLGDGHSFLNLSAEDRALYAQRHGKPLPTVAAKVPTSPFMKRREAVVSEARAGRGRVAVAQVPVRLGGGAAAAAYAQTLYDGLANRSARQCGAVVDLRGNGGGNVWPMLLGLSPLLGQYTGRDLRDDGKIHDYAAVKDGKVTIVDPADPNVGVTFMTLDGWKAHPRLARWPVAVLTDDAVGSSGEGVAVAFAARPRTRRFGQATYGIASANEGFMLGERANLVVTTAMMVDGKGRTYPDGLKPDVAVANPASADAKVDPVMGAALRWLGRQPGCR